MTVLGIAVLRPLSNLWFQVREGPGVDLSPASTPGFGSVPVEHDILEHLLLEAVLLVI